MTGKQFLVPILALTLFTGVGVTAPSAASAATTSSNPNVIGSRKATQADVDSGFAANLAATIWLCSDNEALYGANITPVGSTTPVLDAKEGAKVAWEESVTSSGRPEARINTGNAIFAFSNHAAGTNPEYFAGSEWAGGYVLYEYAFAKWATRLSVQNQIRGGGQLGMYIHTNGTVDTQNGTWRNAYSSTYGFRQWIPYSPNTNPDSLPSISFRMVDQHFKHQVGTDYEIRARGTSCGTLNRVRGYVLTQLP